MKWAKKDLSGCHKQGTLADLGLPIKKVCPYPGCPYNGVPQDQDKFYDDYKNCKGEGKKYCKICWAVISKKDRIKRENKEKEKEFLNEQGD